MTARSECQNCEWTGDDDETLPVQRPFARVAPGEPMPTGECPECGALCQPIDREPTDDEIYNGYGMEGGIAYDPDAGRALDEHDWRL